MGVGGDRMKEKLYVQPLGSEGYMIMRDGSARERVAMVHDGIQIILAYCTVRSDAERIKACLDAFSGLTTEQILDGKWLKGGM